MDKRDVALQQQCPIVTVPMYSPFEPSDAIGDRILMASNGVFLETTRKWGRFVRKVGAIEIVVPFGVMTESTNIYCGRIPSELFTEFNRMAGVRHHIEIGASIIWNDQTNQFRLAESIPITATGSSLHQFLAPLGQGDHLIVDCHSHSHHRAFFSGTDDKDDLHSVKFSYVVGDCSSSTKSKKIRLCIRGIFTNLDAEHFEN